MWHIWIDKKKDGIYIIREYGQLNGKITKISKKMSISEKRVMTEVSFLFKKKKESGFTDKLNNVNKSVIIKPMGAHKLEDHKHKIIYPALVQRKLDGFRCLANKAELYSKNMKPFHFLHHIRSEIKKLNLPDSIYLDGELYSYGRPLREISSSVMKKYASAEEEEQMKHIEYHIFDIIDLNHMDFTFFERYKNLEKLLKNKGLHYLKLVICHEVKTYEDVIKLNEIYLYEGYEGIIVRNKNGIYKLNSKSYDVLRTKEFKKNYFMIVGAKEGTGTQKGAIIWKLKCLHGDKTFWAIPIGTIPERIKLYNDFKRKKKIYIGKMAYIKYLEIDKDGCVTRNPIVESIV
jgi:ATP-dependent DNA ligase